MITPHKSTAVITGASSGIGLATARALATAGWNIIAVGRDPNRSAQAEEKIREVSQGGQVNMLVADLALMSEAERLASEIEGLTDRIHLLINNAGGMASDKVITREGLEENFAGNHLGPFLLTNRLLLLLKRAAMDAPKGRVRIINTSSDASEMVPTLNLEDMQNLGNFSVGLAYCSSKLANVLFTRALARRLEDDGIVAHSLHPGTVDSNFFSSFGEEAKSRLQGYTMQTPEEGADTLIWLATADEPGESSGGYFYQRAQRTPNPIVDDVDFVEQFWRASEKLVSSAGRYVNG